MNYVNSEDGSQYGEKYAFLIESTKELEERLQASEINQFSIGMKDINPQRAQELALFQYMIGNADWQLPFMHNVKLFKKDNVEFPIAVPYDFDCAGLVNSTYAKPNPDFQQKDVRERIYMASNKDFLPETIELFKEKKSVFISLIHDFELLNEASKADLLEFVQIFYDILESKKQSRKAFQPLKNKFY